MNKQVSIEAAGLVEAAYGTETFTYFDIETIPAQNPALADKLAEGIKAPSNYKDAEKMENYKTDKGVEAMAKTSFEGGWGHVCTIAWATNNEPVQLRHSYDLGDEIAVLGEFFNSFPKYKGTTLVGHNIIGFDIPFLTKRAICLGVEMPGLMCWPRSPKPWARGCFDTMTAWDGRNFVSQDNLCAMLGMEGKGDFDGSMVATAWANGEHETIWKYCAADVERTRQIHQRFLASGY